MDQFHFERETLRIDEKLQIYYNIIRDEYIVERKMCNEIASASTVRWEL